MPRCRISPIRSTAGCSAHTIVVLLGRRAEFQQRLAFGRHQFQGGREFAAGGVRSGRGQQASKGTRVPVWVVLPFPP
jgi:hypothetical protein